MLDWVHCYPESPQSATNQIRIWSTISIRKTTILHMHLLHLGGFFFPIPNIMPGNKLWDWSFQKYQFNELSYYKMSSIYCSSRLCPTKIMVLFKNRHSAHCIQPLRNTSNNHRFRRNCWIPCYPSQNYKVHWHEQLATFLFQCQCNLIKPDISLTFVFSTLFWSQLHHSSSHLKKHYTSKTRVQSLHYSFNSYSCIIQQFFSLN